MSEQPSAPAPAPAHHENVLTHKLGPLPTWAWIGIAGGGLVAWRMYDSYKAAKSGESTSAAATSPTTAADQVPQFVNQFYLSSVAPSAPSPSAATTSGTGSTTPRPPRTPVNPSPVSPQPGSAPKPTTTLPGDWHYPAPSALTVADKATTGVTLSWDAVTGPSGQHPNSYTVATYNSKGQLVDQFDTSAGNTSAKEYGKGGKGMPKGSYATNVWANGGPVAPPHSTVKYTLAG
jgi:hypothetical protein